MAPVGGLSSSAAATPAGSGAFWGGGSLPFNHGSIQASSTHLAKYLRRAGTGIDTNDVEYLAYQFVYATLAPSKVYNLTTYRKHIKNQWARDEPSFALLLLGLLTGSSVAWGVAYSVPLSSPLSYAWLVAVSWLHFLLVGALVCTACWAVANRSLRSLAPLPYSTSAAVEVEWAFAWDLHCNGFTTVFWALHVVQLLAAPVTLGPGWLCALLSNALHGVAIVGYCYVVHLGYAMLPFLRRPNVFLAPAAVAVVLLTLLTALGINVGRLLLGLYIE